MSSILDSAVSAADALEDPGTTDVCPVPAVETVDTAVPMPLDIKREVISLATETNAMPQYEIRLHDP
jgi:hypothetical protein